MRVCACYQGASLDYGEDAAEDARADQKLLLLSEVQVDVMEHHREQDPPGL